MNRLNKLTALAAVVALSVGLAACGGGSSAKKDDGEPMPDPAIAERAAITSAIMAARTAVPGVDNESTDSEVSAADMAIANARAAIAAANAVPAAEKEAHTATVNALAAQLNAAKTARTAAMDAADKAAAAAMAKTGKALHAALGPPPTENTTALNNISAPILAAAGLTIDAVAGAGALPDATDPGDVQLKAGASAGSLGGWMGMDYAHMDTGTEIKNEARVYTNRGAPTSKAFSSVHTLDDATAGTINVSETSEIALVGGSAFAHSGLQNHVHNATGEAAFVTRGTYDGAPGQYKCTGTCTSTNDGDGAPSALGGTWTFKPDAGAMVSQPDGNYLYFGWWVSKDKDGGPTAASAFASIVGDVDGSNVTTTSGGDLTGSATYAGKAAGKFAMSNPLDGTGNGGHFTADAMLTATFGSGTDAGMTGTINNFMLNDTESAAWSVELKSAGWGNTHDFARPQNDTAGTVWSINSNKAPASGTWSGQMYDEMPGNAPDGDGNNIPTTVTGTFYSEFSTIGRMVGGFGANKQ